MGSEEAPDKNNRTGLESQQLLGAGVGGGNRMTATPFRVRVQESQLVPRWRLTSSCVAEGEEASEKDLERQESQEKHA